MGVDNNQNSIEALQSQIYECEREIDLIRKGNEEYFFLLQKLMGLLASNKGYASLQAFEEMERKVDYLSNSIAKMQKDIEKIQEKLFGHRKDSQYMRNPNINPQQRFMGQHMRINSDADRFSSYFISNEMSSSEKSPSRTGDTSEKTIKIDNSDRADKQEKKSSLSSFLFNRIQKNN